MGGSAAACFLHAAQSRQREALGEWTKGGQQQLSDRRHQRDGLQRSSGNVRSVAESRCDPGVQGADFALRCQPGKKRGWKRKRDSEVWNERAPWGCVRILSQRRFERERILPEQGGTGAAVGEAEHCWRQPPRSGLPGQVAVRFPRTSWN